jgi:hypothetical protein
MSSKAWLRASGIKKWHDPRKEPMRIQNTDDYKKYQGKLGACTADCKGKHSGLIDNGCGLPPGSPAEEI